MVSIGSEMKGVEKLFHPGNIEKSKDAASTAKIETESNSVTSTQVSEQKAQQVQQELIEELKKLNTEEEKALLQMMQIYALGGNESVIEYMRSARDFANEKGVDIFQVMSPSGQYYQRFVEFIQNRNG